MICSDQSCSFPGQWTLPDAVLTITSRPAAVAAEALGSTSIVHAGWPSMPRSDLVPRARPPSRRKKDSRDSAKPAQGRQPSRPPITPDRSQAGEDGHTLTVTAKLDPPGTSISTTPAKPDDGPKLTLFDLFDPAGLEPEGRRLGPRSSPADQQARTTPSRSSNSLEFYEDEVNPGVTPLTVPGRRLEPGPKSLQVQVRLS